MKLLKTASTQENIFCPKGEIRHFNVGKKETIRIIPIFLPFAGCPGKCVFCAQDRQSGQSEQDDEQKSQAVLAQLKAIQKSAAFQKNPHLPQLAFYGGTFTALPAARQAFWLDFFTACKKEGLAASCRCSTRPDAVGTWEDSLPLLPLKQARLSLIELGVQSFNSTALNLARRGYSGQAAATACHTVRHAGFALGVQLLPGMPGVTPDIFLADVEQALELKPDCMRFYPCLVPEGTELAKQWQAGTYVPWSLEDTISTLGRALSLAWAADVPVIRLSVAPEEAFDSSLLAGPRHPALGSMVQAQALLHTVISYLQGQQYEAAKLTLPAECQGFAWGYKGSLRSEWNTLRVTLSFEQNITAATLAW